MNNLQLNDNNNNEFICGVVEGFYGKPWTCDQRKDLFKQLKELNLNAFMYAPKDDTKHRSKWRQLYSESEASDLKKLIDDAKENGIDFYYSLAPGLDMIYSEREELNLLIRKYDQLKGLGCTSFAILFDDIEPSINEKDREVFKNYASAQVSITNTIFEHLKRPKFLFCPTEYCESRAIPNVTNSGYLNTLGIGLLGGIDIMWSGSRVISRLITEESIETLTKVIRRPPVIWENLHANDYDKKRIFLGPYSGRSTKIIPKLKGVLTNPNCEYEANYIAIHTLAHWSKCTEDINPHNRCDPNQLSAVSQKNRESLFEKEHQTSHSIYDPQQALLIAINNWLPRVLESRSSPSGMNLNSQFRQRNDETASNQITKEVGTHDEVKDIDVEENNVDMVPDETKSSATSLSTNKSDMDTSSSPGTTNAIETNSCDSCEMPDVTTDPNLKQNNPNCSKCFVCSSLGRTRNQDEQVVKIENLSLLVDLFYLPFEHGVQGHALLKDIKWLKDNSDALIGDNLHGEQTRMNADDEDIGRGNSGGDELDTSDKLNMVESWYDRAEKLNNLCSCISRLVNTLIYDCPNKLLIIELYPYLADMRDVAAMIADYIKFLRYRTTTQDRFYYSNTNSSANKLKEFPVSSDEQEPWIFRGGLIGDVQRLLS